jgi:integrase
MLHKAEEWKLLFRAPKFRLVKEHGRSLALDAAVEAKLITAAALCGWRAKSFDLFRDVVVLMRETGMRNERELYRVRIENIDWMNKLIFIPDSKTQSGRRKVPMSDRAMAILSVRCAGKSEGWVFPSKRSSAGHLTTVGKCIVKLAIKPACRRTWFCTAVGTITEPACCGRLEIWQP